MQHPNYGLTISKEEGFVEDSFINPLPRAVLRSATYVLLDGEWKFSIDTHDVGIKDNWQSGHSFPDVAHWPGSIEEHMAKAKGNKPEASWTDKIIAWYEREFPRPKIADERGRENTLLQLSFGACGYETMVWLNGVQLETIEGELVHRGAYTSFAYELDAKLLKPVNRLTVRISDTMDADLPRGKQESHVYKRGGIWYQTYTGAVRSVWLETVERNRLRSRVGVESVIEENLVKFTIRTRIHDAGNYTVRLDIYHRKQEQPGPIVCDKFELKLEAGERDQQLVLGIPNAIVWSPDDPHLYLLHAQLVDEYGYASEIETYFGLRKIESRGSKIYLNNEPIYLDGILYQPGTATYEEIKKHMLAMKELGCNMVRIHIAGVDPRIYNLADKIGMLLWVEVPSAHSSTSRSRQFHKEELMRMLSLIGTHPSVVIWSLYNEDWGAQDIADNVKTRQYIRYMYHYMHATEPKFLVVDNDGWQHLSFDGKLTSDLLTAHVYTPELEQWKKVLDNMMTGKLDEVAVKPLVIGDPYFYKKQVPLIVSEWGGFGFPDYGGPVTSYGRTDLIKAFKQELRTRPFAGDVYTQATNIEEEQNGIIDEKTGALKVPAGLLRSEPDSGGE